MGETKGDGKFPSLAFLSGARGRVLDHEDISFGQFDGSCRLRVIANLETSVPATCDVGDAPL